jgi:ZIP family zinc transporter
MSTWQTVLLGAIAGSTIFLGLPLGRMQQPRPRLRAFLNAGSAGILLFLFFDIVENATEPVEHAVEALQAGSGGWGAVAGMGLVYVTGFAAGLVSLLYLGTYQRSRRAPSIGPGAMAVAEVAPDGPRAALALGMSIAAGIGLHNFSEGLAIGQAAHGGALSLALLLVIGFALHNATEGFGIVGPLAAEGVRGSWPYLFRVGLVAGGPTFLGTLVGTVFASEYIFVAFLTLAAGAIIYVVAELLFIGRRLDWPTTVWGLLAGFVLGLGTELILVAAGV